MIRLLPLRVLILIAMSVALIGIPQSASAQRGGHGGGGGFHGGGSAFHGGGNFGGFRGGAGGFHGGFGGFRGRGYGGFYGRGFGGFRGRPFYGGFGFPGYGFGFGFGFGPYWGYPYYYGYGPWSPYAYYYPYDYYYPDGPDYYRDDPYPRGNRDGCDYRHEDDHPCKSHNQNAPPKPSSTVPESAPEYNYVTTNPADNGSAFSLAEYRSSASADRDAVNASVAGDRQLTDSSTSQLPSGLRPAVRNVIQALRATPPGARQRQLNSGRYHSLSPEELEFVTNATQPSPALATR